MLHVTTILLLLPLPLFQFHILLLEMGILLELNPATLAPTIEIATNTPVEVSYAQISSMPSPTTLDI